jgi:hypothetical protein
VKGPIFELSSRIFAKKGVGRRKVWVERWVKVGKRGKVEKVEEDGKGGNGGNGGED